MSIESMMPSNHLILCHPLLLLPSIFPTSGPMGWYKYSSLKETVEGEIKEGEIKNQKKKWSIENAFFGFGGSFATENSKVKYLNFSFKYSTIFKVFTEFVATLLLLYTLVSWLQGIQDLSSPTRNWTPTSCIGRWSLFHWIIREVPLISLLVRWFLTCLSDSLDVCDLESGERLEMENQKNGQKGGRKRRDQSLSQW